MKDQFRKQAEKRSIDLSCQPVIQAGLKQGIETAWERLEKQQPQCGFGQLGICCTNCEMGPCRIDPFGNDPQKGVCGATADTIVARNLIRMLATGAAAHSDHGREVVEVLHDAATGRADAYPIKDVEKLKILAEEYGIDTDGAAPNTLAESLALKILEEFGTIKGKTSVL